MRNILKNLSNVFTQPKVKDQKIIKILSTESIVQVILTKTDPLTENL